MYTIHMRSCLLADRKEDITVSIQLLLHPASIALKNSIEMPLLLQDLHVC